MKKKYLIVQFVASLAIIYPAFVFTFYSFNPSNWNAIGRFAYVVLSTTLFLSFAYLSKEQAEELNTISKELKEIEDAMAKIKQNIGAPGHKQG